MLNIGSILSKSIKEGKWVEIKYLNQGKEETCFWCAIKDIEPISRTLFIKMFNSSKGLDTLDAHISFDKIQDAELVPLSTFDYQEKLVKKIEENPSQFEFLNYEFFNQNILGYYEECFKYDSDPYQKEYQLIPGIDVQFLKDKRYITLNDEQIRILIQNIYKLKENEKFHRYSELVIQHVSIESFGKKYVLAYYDLSFNPAKRTLSMGKELHFNQSFLVDGKLNSLYNYISTDLNEFLALFESNEEEALALLRESFQHNEALNTRPEIMVLERDFHINLTKAYAKISEEYFQKKLVTPLKAFFGDLSKVNYKSKITEPSIVIFDERINIDQMRVLYNTMKFPVTYVQGPPGTGKTQTLLNVVLSVFFNKNTVLVCSSNNKPVDGIAEKLDSFKYKDTEFKLPYLRLGNKENLAKATRQIKYIYQHLEEYKGDPKENLLDGIKSKNDSKNKQLVEYLKIYEQRRQIEDMIQDENELLSHIDGSSPVYDSMVKSVLELKNKLKELPDVTNKMVLDLFSPANSDFHTVQFLYFETVRRLRKLKEPKYKELLEICNIYDEEVRVKAFYKWMKEDENIDLLNDVFPIILTTNISAASLGSGQYKFDLVVMDEAGQCQPALALLPILRGKKLLLVGDPEQLKPIVLLDGNVNEKLKEKYQISSSYDYCGNSIMDVMIKNDKISKFVLLRYHYRCGKNIINFSNRRYYHSQLLIDHIKDLGNLSFLQVKNNNSLIHNANFEEAQAIVQYCKNNQVNNCTILTPFVNQANLIRQLLEREGVEEIDVGTIHSLQGAEKDTIIFSPSISPKTSRKTYQWLKDNAEIINVGVTRAKKKLIIAADMEAIDALSEDKKDDLYTLIQYVKNNGAFEVVSTVNPMVEIGKSNGSQNEAEFFTTVGHFCSVNKEYVAKRNVPFSEIFKDDETLRNRKFEFDLVLYQKNFFGTKPLLAFEIDGGEHFGRASQEKYDSYKREVCKKKGIQLVVIPNSFVKEYDNIAKVIFASQKKKGKQDLQLSLFEELMD